MAWLVVYRPTDPGGLGVTDLRFFGFALRLRWEWLSRSEPQRCWTSLSSRSEKCMAMMCAASMSVVVDDDALTRLWTDNRQRLGHCTSSLRPFTPRCHVRERRDCCMTRYITIVGRGTSLEHQRHRSSTITCAFGSSCAWSCCSHCSRTALSGSGCQREGTRSPRHTEPSLQGQQDSWVPESFGAQKLRHG